MNRRCPASTNVSVSFTLDQPWPLVSSQADQFDGQEMVRTGPFQEFKIRNEFGLDSHALLHLAAINSSPHLPLFASGRLRTGKHRRQTSNLPVIRGRSAE